MELEVKNLDAVLETLDKFHDTLYAIYKEFCALNDEIKEISLHDNLFEISNSLVTIKEVLLGKFSESELHFEVEHFIERLKEILDEKK